jgi:hypothetical protein
MYSPKVREELVVELYQLKQQIGKPMTKLVNEAVVEYLKRRRESNGLHKSGNKDT